MKLNDIDINSIEKVLTIERKAKVFGLEAIKKFLNLIGNPEKKLKIIHVAGTNGKGSVCAMISSVLSEAGFKEGMFTSPHLMKVNERIRINDELISDEDFRRIADFIYETEKKNNVSLTFFETLTIMAFIYFNEKKADYAVMETGMGGRLDATNVSQPIISVITNIGLEHKDVLGNTIKEIANEKAGIIKPNTTVVTSAKGKALSVIENIAEKHNSKLVVAKKLSNINLRLKGEYQKENASTAFAVLKELGLNEDIILNGLKNAYWPGRFEFMDGNILLDCAHNPDGIKALVKSIKKLDYNNLIVVIGVMKDKDISSIEKKLEKLNPMVIATKASLSRSKEPEEIAKYFENIEIIPDLKKAIKYAVDKAEKNDLILITGSIYVVGEAYPFITKDLNKL
ncbi:MAG: bifunctional folylpolyglutamate synthase/dihydrofolate synthase [Candidatus Nanoarchaeia archaeon]|nr:bifunctional folylpolyglutamate synthase/dihydrofolate synthase [Candidatus Nanoarchaeia archaeon]